jgi:uncharacterized protein (DUF1778 family)
MPPLEAHNTSDHLTSKTARLEARITPDQKALFERAAALSGCTISDFVINSAQEIAARMVCEQEMMTLSARPQGIRRCIAQAFPFGSRASPSGAPLLQGDGPVNDDTTGLATVPYRATIRYIRVYT